MLKEKKCKIYLCNKKAMDNSNYCCKDHEKMDDANDTLNEMLWNGETPFK